MAKTLLQTSFKCLCTQLVCVLALCTISTSLSGATITSKNSSGCIIERHAQLNHPEGICFTPDGNFVAIANSGGNNILFYRTPECISTYAKAKPVFVLNIKSKNVYPHDVTFAPDGSCIAIACPHTNHVAIHLKSKTNGFYEQEPYRIIDCHKAGVKGIHAVKFNPQGTCFAVCDVIGHQIALYRCGYEEYETLPFQMIGASSNLTRAILDRPDGLAFSSDGTLLAVTSHGTHSVLLFERLSLSSDEYTSSPVEIIQGKETGFCFTHSVAFHPQDNTLAVSSAGGRKTLALFKQVSNNPPYYSKIPSQTFEIYNPESIHNQKWAPEEGGVKGIAFSPDGTTFGACASDIVDPTRSILFYTVQ